MSVPDDDGVEKTHIVFSDWSSPFESVAKVDLSAHSPLEILQYEVPADQTAEGKERLRVYYESLGRFVQMYAEAEKVLMQTLWAYAGTKPEVAKIAFQGTSPEQVANFTKAIARATDAAKENQDDLEFVLQQFGTIRGTRNGILHFGAEDIAKGKGIVSDAWKAKAEPKEFSISAEDLEAMEADLRKIIAHLGYRHLGRAWPKGALGRTLLDDTLAAPWRYKRPPALRRDRPAVRE